LRKYEGSKRCGKCEEIKSLDEFNRAPERKGGYHGYCKVCLEIYNSERYKYDLEANRSKNLKRLYGIAPEEYQAMFTAQNGECAACGQPETATDSRTKQVRNLQIDHSHITGKIRALLCKECNNALGLLRDDPERIRLLLRYTELYQADEELLALGAEK
jgi:hypothetical protein